MSHYSVKRLEGGMDALRAIFPKPDSPDDMNFVLFSTSGVHGTYWTIEDIENARGAGGPEILTVLIVQPRMVSMTYGIVRPLHPEDFAYLKALRASSHATMARIGL